MSETKMYSDSEGQAWVNAEYADMLQAKLDAFRWRDVRSELPPANVSVLVYQQIYGRRLMVWDGLNWRCEEPGDTLPPYYWMPLPEPPELEDWQKPTEIYRDD